MSHQFQNMFQGGGQGGFVNDQNNFPTLGGNQQQQQQQQPFYGGQQQQVFPGQQPQFQYQAQPQFGGSQPGFMQQNQFPGFAPPQEPVNPAPATSAPAGGAAASSNPFASSAGANPFASAATSNPFAGGAVKEFKPKVPGRIMDDDEDNAPIGFDHFVAGGKKVKNKQKTQAELKAEKEKAEAEANALLSFKGKPASFFIMDYVPGDTRDPTNQMRVPTTEQSVFIYTHYPTESQSGPMIMKLYSLYNDALSHEQAQQAQQDAYKRPSGKQQQQVEEEVDEVIDLGEDTNLGAIGGKRGKQNKAAVKKQQEQEAKAKAEKKAQKVVKKPVNTEQKEEAAQKKIATQIKDINVVPDEDVVDVDETKTPASFVFIGHVDAGKSTICGNLIYSMGIVDQRTIDKFKKEAKDKGRDSWWLAYVMDSSDEEKAKGKTVEMGRAVIDTETKQYTIFDAPGHKNYVPNMIMGATLADFGGLVISARRGEFEAGFDQDGQTREHIWLARSLGIDKLVIVVNKMDEATVSWKKQRWDQIRESLGPFLTQCGYKESDIFWVPISGLTGHNIVEPISSDICSWYDGPTLLQILDNMPIEQRNAEAPLRIPVLDKMKDGNRSVIFGKIEQGTMRLGDKLAIAPSNYPCQVLNIVNDKQQQVAYARPGDNVQVKVSYLEEEQIFKGDCLCPRDVTMPVSQVIEAEVDLLDLLKPIFSKGSQCMMHIHTYAEEITIKDIKWAKEKDASTGEEVKKDMPKFTRSFAKCLVRITTKAPIPVEKMSECAALGRFTLRDEGKTIAIGRVMRYIPFNKARTAAASTAPAGDASAKPQSAQAAATANDPSKDKVAAVVFNLETGETEAQAPPLNNIAEEDEEAKDQN